MSYSLLHRLIPMSILFLSTALGVLAADITADSNCSLAEAITSANADAATGSCPAGDGADIIHLTGDITLTAELPQITSDITIEGGGYTISGDNSFRIFYIAGGALNINELTLVNGSAERGGAIYNEGVLNISDSRFWNNAAEHLGGAIVSDGMLSIMDSIFVENRTMLDGGAIANFGAMNITSSSFTNNSADRFVGAGGAIANYGELNIDDSIFTSNSAGIGGGAISSRQELKISDSSFTENTVVNGEGGAIDNIAGRISIVDSSFSGNSGDDGGGAIANISRQDSPSALLSIIGSAFTGNRTRQSGGAILSNDYGVLEISDSSFTENSARFSGGALSSFGELNISDSTFAGNLAESRAGAILVFSASTATLAHLTVVNNLSTEGGGIFVWHEDTALDVYNSLIFGNDGGDCSGQLNQNSGNLIADGSCDPTISGDPLLGALVESDDGSPVYYPLMPASPAIDAADPKHCAASDQIGTPRPQGDGCDIGAIEFTGE